MSTGFHARRATGLTVAEGAESCTRAEWVARWSREGRAEDEAQRKALLLDFLFFIFVRTGARCSNQAENMYMRGDGDFPFFLLKFSVSFRIFLRCCCAVLM